VLLQKVRPIEVSTVVDSCDLTVIYSLVFSPNGEYLAIGSKRELRIYVPEGAVLVRLDGDVTIQGGRVVCKRVNWEQLPIHSHQDDLPHVLIVKQQRLFLVIRSHEALVHRWL
jgi:hypothetical protein